MTPESVIQCDYVSFSLAEFGNKIVEKEHLNLM